MRCAVRDSTVPATERVSSTPRTSSPPTWSSRSTPVTPAPCEPGPGRTTSTRWCCCGRSTPTSRTTRVTVSWTSPTPTTAASRGSPRCSTRSRPPGRACWGACGPTSRAEPLQGLDAGEHLGQRVLGVTEQQRGLGFVEQLVLDPREARPHRALEKHHLLRPRHLHDRHPVDRRSGRGLRGRVDDVVGADDQANVPYESLQE